MEALNDAPIAVHPVDVRGLVSTSEGFRRAVDDSSAYYLFGYHLDTKNDKPGMAQTQNYGATVRMRWSMPAAVFW